MKPTLQFRLSQHLTLTPQLQQSIRLLQLSTVELNQEIEQLLMENPILEREDGESDAAAAGAAASPEREAPAGTSADEPAGGDPERNEQLPPDFAAPWRGTEDGGADEDGERGNAAADLPTLRDHLNSELALTNLSERDRALVGLLIDALDDDGYLTQSLEDIAALMAAEAEVTVEELAIEIGRAHV